MKRCPTCNQQFTDEWLTFCTSDGTSLVEVRGSTEPPPTFAYPPIPPTVARSEEPTLDFPDAYKPPPVPAIVLPPSPAGWQAPPPPPFIATQQNSMAAISLVLGIVSMTIGWCCSFGVLTAPVAIALGIAALVQIRNNPTRYGGKGMAIGGIATGGLYIVFMVLMFLFYGIAILAGGLSNL
ncbi:MAG TPA: DUF4190 domain-containing protein [Pyrinomonadaceae bacterium]|nr:DUF4190 domain-containing protein [Pyrinomonadaceae bacterium]